MDPESLARSQPQKGPSARLRLSLFYAALFAMPGIFLPFWPVWLAAQDIGPDQIGIVLAIGVWARILATPLVANFADLRAERRRPIIWCAWASLFAVLQFIWIEGFYPIFLVSLLFGMAWSPIGPLGENLTVTTARAESLDYGRIRIWGSVTFMLVNIAAGFTLQGRDPEIILTLVIVGTLAAALVCHLLPDVRVPPASRAAGRPVGRLLREPAFLLFLLGAALIGSSHGLYYTFGSLYWRSIGLSDTVIGILWAEGVLAEILLFYFGQRLMRRFGALNLLLLAAAAASIRWPLTALSASLWPLVLLQALHALTFAAAHLGAMNFLARAIPPSLSASAQSVYSISVWGITLGLSMYLSGALYTHFEAGAYHAMGLCGLCGGVAILALRLRWTGQALIAA